MVFSPRRKYPVFKVAESSNDAHARTGKKVAAGGEKSFEQKKVVTVQLVVEEVFANGQGAYGCKNRITDRQTLGRCWNVVADIVGALSGRLRYKMAGVQINRNAMQEK